MDIELEDKWVRLIALLPEFVMRLSTIDRMPIDTTTKSVLVEKEILRFGYSRTPLPKSHHLAKVVYTSISSGFWYEILSLHTTIETIRVCARYMKRFKFLPHDFTRMYIDSVSEETTKTSVVDRIDVMMRYGILDFNGMFFDEIEDGVVVCLSYVVFLTMIPLRLGEMGAFKDLVETIVMEFGADPTVDMYTPLDPILKLPTQEMRDRLSLMRDIYTLHSTDNFIERESKSVVRGVSPGPSVA